jgi:hypothetical protein
MGTDVVQSKINDASDTQKPNLDVIVFNFVQKTRKRGGCCNSVWAYAATACWVYSFTYTIPLQLSPLNR